MEPSCSVLYHIQDKVLPDVYTLGAIIEHRIPQQSNPPQVVTEDHGGIQHVSKQLAEDIIQPDNFTQGHTRSCEFSLSGAQRNRLLYPAHPGYRSRTQRERALKSALAILHTTRPVNIRIIMQLHISDNVSQSMRDCAPKISQKILAPIQ